jgi:hypothetical protein
MAEGDGAFYNGYKPAVLLAEHNMDTNDIKVMLVTGYTPNVDTHADYADVSSFECSGPGYTAGGESIGNTTVTQDDANDRGIFDGDDVTWANINVGPPSHAITYNNTHASKKLVCYWELETTTNGGNYTLQFNPVGVFTLN